MISKRSFQAIGCLTLQNGQARVLRQLLLLLFGRIGMLERGNDQVQA